LAGDPAARRRLGRLGGHLTAATAAGHPHELVGRTAALAAFRAAAGQPAKQTRRSSMIKTAIAKLLTIKAGVVLAAAAAGGVALAASTGALPNPLANTPATAPGTAHTSGRPATAPGAAADQDGPSAMPSPALVGLCHAYTAGAGSQHGKALADPAFTALIRAAGGTDKVNTFCAAVLAAAPGAAPSHPGGPDNTHASGTPSGAAGNGGHPSGPPSAHPSAAPSHPGH
jgi:hypothetical protein